MYWFKFLKRIRISAIFFIFYGHFIGILDQDQNMYLVPPSSQSCESECSDPNYDPNLLINHIRIREKSRIRATLYSSKQSPGTLTHGDWKSFHFRSHSIYTHRASSWNNLYKITKNILVWLLLHCRSNNLYGVLCLKTHDIMVFCGAFDEIFWLC